MKRLPYSLLLFLVAIIFSYPNQVLAQAAPPPCIPTEIRICVPTNPVDFTITLYNSFLGLMGAVALIYVMYGAYLILSSQGDALQVKKGRSFINHALIGIILAISGLAVYQLIARDILKIPGFGV